MNNKSYISDILYIDHVHPSGDLSMNGDPITSAPAIIGGGFLGGLVVKQ
jgi:hypothetical protein